MKTGYWSGRYPDDHMKIGISRGRPRWLAAANYRLYAPLAPGAWFKTVDLEEYDLRYAEVLRGLDAGQVFDEITALAQGKTPVLCCFEKAPGPDFCHRSLVSEWFADQIGLIVPEYGFDHVRDHPLLPTIDRLAKAK